VTEQQLHGSQVAGFLVNLCRLGSPQRVSPVSRAGETGALDPAMDDPSVLSSRNVWLAVKAAREEVLAACWTGIG